MTQRSDDATPHGARATGQQAFSGPQDPSGAADARAASPTSADSAPAMEQPAVKVRDVMSRGVEVVGPDDTLQDAAQHMRRLDVGLLPVCDGTRLLGMITDRDIAVRAVAEGRAAHVAVKAVMTPEVHYCFEDQDVDAAAQQMHAHQIRRLPVLDRDQRLVGIVALADLAVRHGDDELSGRVLEGVSEPAL